MCAWCCCRTWRPTWSTSPRSSCGRSSCRRSDTGGGGWGPSQGGRGARVGAGGPGAAAGGKDPRVHSAHRLREGGDHALTLRGDEHPRGSRPSDLRGPRLPAPWPSAPSPAAREPGQAPPSGPRFVLISCERRHRWPQAARLRTGRPHLWVRGEAPVPPPGSPGCPGVSGRQSCHRPLHVVAGLFMHMLVAGRSGAHSNPVRSRPQVTFWVDVRF